MLKGQKRPELLAMQKTKDIIKCLRIQVLNDTLHLRKLRCDAPHRGCARLEQSIRQVCGALDVKLAILDGLERDA